MEGRYFYSFKRRKSIFIFFM